MELCPRVQIVHNLVVRVPLLYGFVECLSESAVTTLLSNIIASDVLCELNNVRLRYPTYCDDFAFVIRQLIDKRRLVFFYCSVFTG